MNGGETTATITMTRHGWTWLLATAVMALQDKAEGEAWKGDDGMSTGDVAQVKNKIVSVLIAACDPTDKRVAEYLDDLRRTGLWPDDDFLRMARDLVTVGYRADVSLECPRCHAPIHLKVP